MKLAAFLAVALAACDSPAPHNLQQTQQPDPPCIRHAEKMVDLPGGCASYQVTSCTWEGNYFTTTCPAKSGRASTDIVRQRYRLVGKVLLRDKTQSRIETVPQSEE